MNILKKEALLSALKKLGVELGDTLFVHSDLRVFGIPEGRVTREEILQFYFSALSESVGTEGTISAPAYFYEYARSGIPFDVDHSPVSQPLGSFCEWLVKYPQRIRSCNPLQSIVAIGKRAHELAGSTSLSGYGVTSPWHKLRHMGGKFLFLGAPIQSMTFVHYIEQHYGVPHLYCKIYPYPVMKDGVTLPGKPTSFVRFLDFSVQYELKAYQEELERAGVLHKAYVNTVPVYLVRAPDAYQIGIRGLEKNPYFFLRHPPKFIPGQIPLDGIYTS